ncbi:MAG TPA: hypothetical protein PLM75_05650, partial [bacterium]|nr:hypothetical protein [bacterium]
MKNRIIAVITKIIIFIFALVSGINAAPASINSLHFYTSSSFTDSSITAVTIGSSFYIMADTDAPTAPKIPPDTFLVVITHDSNPFDTVYITLTQDATDSRLYKSEKIEIVANGLSNSQLNQIGVLENSGEYIRTFYNNIEYDSLVVAISQQPSALNNLN